MLRGWNGLWCPNCVWDEVVPVSAAAAAGAPLIGAGAVGAIPSSGLLGDRPGDATVMQGNNLSLALRRVSSSRRREARDRGRAVGTLASTARRREVAALGLTVTQFVRSSAQGRRVAQADGVSEGAEEA